MKKLLSILLCAALIFVPYMTAGAKTLTADAASDFQPVLRFVASSDTHIKDENDLTAQRITQMMQTAYALAAQDSKHPQVDALLIAGDVTNDGTKSEFEKLKKTVYGALKDETRFLAIAAKNHDGYDMKRSEVRDTIASITGNDADFHVVINGYHFIGLSVSAHPLSHYDKGQLAWLKEQLDAATAEDADKPVFVMHHEHVKNTVFGSSGFERWYVTHFNDILTKYPQVVDFSGHSHYPLNHPDSVWQGAFTAIGTGAVFYTDYTVEDLRDCSSSATNENVSNFWLVELDAANRMRLRGIDLLARKVLCEYILDNPADPANREFTPEKKAQASTAPVFEPNTGLSVSVEKGTCNIQVAPAKSTDGMPIVLYRAFATDTSGKVISKTWTMPWYCIADAPDTVKLTLQGLGKGTYTLSVVAETAYGVQSEALKTELTLTEPGQCAAFFTRVDLWLTHLWDVFLGLF